MNIGFDLDKVLINYPPIIPTRFIDWCYRRHDTPELSYKIPTGRLERQIRLLTHFYPFRPAIKKNVDLLKSWTQKYRDNRLFLISSRYGFLEKLTLSLLKRYSLTQLFKDILLNTKDEQPHKFKEAVIKRLEIQLYIDDDLDLLKYLQSHNQKIKLLWYNPNRGLRDHDGIVAITEFSQMEAYF